jgi:hypothetical protein
MSVAGIVNLFTCNGCTCSPWWLQVRQVLTEYVVLPLGSQQLHERLSLINTLLLYGAPHTGKTLLTQVRHQG